VNRFALRHFVRSALWLVPLLCLLGFTVLAVATLAIDRAADFGLVSGSVTGSATSVQQLFSTAASSLLSLATRGAPERRPRLDRELELLKQAVRSEYQEKWDAEFARAPDALGIGSGTDMVARETAQ